MLQFSKVLALLAATCFATSAHSARPTSLYQGLISFINAPDPAGRTPVFWATKQTLHHVVHPRAAQIKFGANWVDEIRWCGDAQKRPLAGECSDIFYNFRRGNAINENTRDLLNP